MLQSFINSVHVGVQSDAKKRRAAVPTETNRSARADASGVTGAMRAFMLAVLNRKISFGALIERSRIDNHH